MPGGFKFAQLITTKFCTCHDSFTVVTLAKFHCHRPNMFWTRAITNFHWISNSIKISLVGQAPGHYPTLRTYGTMAADSLEQPGFQQPQYWPSFIGIFQFGHQGWGLLSQFPPFCYFPKFSSLSKHTLTVKYRVYIWQVSPQLSCGDICQIWMWFEESNMNFCEIESFAYGEINEWSFSNPHPRKVTELNDLMVLSNL